jgi:preprotein translocase subunit SecF
MFEIFKNINVDWMGIRKPLIAVSILVLLAGLFSAIGRQLTPGGTDAFNLGVDFQGGTVITAKFKGEKPSEDQIRAALNNLGVNDSVIQASLDKTDEVLIKIPILEGSAQPSAQTPAADIQPGDDPNAAINAQNEAQNNQVNIGRAKVKEALDSFGKEAEPALNLQDDPNAAYKIVGTDSVGPVAGEQLRNQAILATLLGLVGILLYIAFRYDWTYAAGAVISLYFNGKLI